MDFDNQPIDPVTEAKLMGGIRLTLPVPWVGSTMAGQMRQFLNRERRAQIGVFLVWVSKVRIPRSHKNHLDIPLIQDVFGAIEPIPRELNTSRVLRTTGLLVLPTSLSSEKITCMFLAAIWSTSTYSHAGHIAGIQHFCDHWQPHFFADFFKNFQPFQP